MIERSEASGVSSTIVSNGTIRPSTPEGDDYYGLALGTNGTAAESRRECAVNGRPLQWVRHNGRIAVGPTLRGAGHDLSWKNPWEAL